MRDKPTLFLDDYWLYKSKPLPPRPDKTDETDENKLDNQNDTRCETFALKRYN